MDRFGRTAATVAGFVNRGDNVGHVGETSGNRVGSEVA